MGSVDRKPLISIFVTLLMLVSSSVGNGSETVGNALNAEGKYVPEEIKRVEIPEDLVKLLDTAKVYPKGTGIMTPKSSSKAESKQSTKDDAGKWSEDDFKDDPKFKGPSGYAKPGSVDLDNSTNARREDGKGMISPIEPNKCGLSGRTFGCFMHPIDKRPKLHAGCDMRAAAGTPIRAVADGEITSQRDAGGYGRQVLLKVGGYTMSFNHLQNFAKSGKVKKGDIIGYVGTSGHSTGPHLHFEVHKDGKKIDPFILFEPSTLCSKTDAPKQKASCSK